MKAKTLKPHSNKKPRYALRAFLWGAVIAALCIVPSMIMDKGVYMYYGDYNIQIIPFYQIMHEAIRSGNFGWNWYTDLGTSLMGGYGYYNLGSPFFWLMLPFPTESIPYLMGPLTILKFGCSSLAAYIYLKRYVKDKNNAVIGAMLYAFSGFAIYNLVYHFIDILVFFPLLLASLDSLIFEKKRGRFAIMVALSAIINYYFFVAEAIFCLIYWIVRMAVKSFKMERKEVLYLFFEAVMGTGIALFMLLPSVYAIVGSTRLTNGGLSGWNMWLYNVYTYAEIIVSFFCPPDMANMSTYISPYQSQWLSITAWLPLFSMAGVFAIIFNKRRNKWMRVFYAVCTVFMFVPILNSSFQLFTESKYVRWFFMLLLIMALGSVTALEDPATKWKKAIIPDLIGVVAIALILGFTPTKTVTEEGASINLGLSDNTLMMWSFFAVAMINIAALVIFISLYKRNKTAFRRYSCLITAFAIFTAFATTFAYGKYAGYTSVDIMKTNMINNTLDIDDVQDWRTDVVTRTDYSGIMFDYDNVETSDEATAMSMRDQTIVDVYEKIADTDSDKAAENSDEEITESAELITSDTDVSDPIAAEDTDDKKENYYENDNLTMGWRIPGLQCFSSSVSSSITQFMSGLGYQRGTISTWYLSDYGIRSLLSVKYMVEMDSSDFKFTDENGETLMPGWKYIDSQMGYNIYENEYVLPMGFTYDAYMTAEEFQKVPMQFRHLALLKCMVVHDLDVDDMFDLASTNTEKKTADDLTFTQEEYFKDCEARQQDACYDFKRDNTGFEAKIDLGDSDKYVFFSVPFDQGWSAEVNGKPAEIKQVDYGFMAVKAPANQTSTIRFNYHTPGVIYGFVVGGICLILVLIYVAAMKMQSLPAADDDEKGKKKKGPDDKDGGDGKNGGGDDKPDGSPNDSSAEPAENDEDITLFDIVKETEEQNMMHTYSRVQVALENGYGAVGYDIEGNKYIDFTAGIGVNCLGYSDGRWLDAIQKQAESLQHASNLYYNVPQIQLAELLCMKTGYSKVFFANSGAEANECAIKIARKYGSDKYGESHTHIITLENSFHGRTITTLSATGQDVFHKHFRPFTEGFSYAKANDMESVKNAVTEDTCAVMIELIQGEGGVNPLDKEFVSELSAYCKENDILLIVDEVQTGVGRTGKLFCYENFDIKPDVITTAKALGGGLPLSACMCSEELQDVLTYGTNGTTFGGNPIACAGAIEILERVSKPEFLDEINEKGDYIRARLEEIDGVKEVRGMGMMIGIVLKKDNAKEVLAKCAESGLLVLTAKNLIRLLPPLNIDYFDIDEGLDILESVINETFDKE